MKLTGGPMKLMGGGLCNGWRGGYEIDGGAYEIDGGGL